MEKVTQHVQFFKGIRPRLDPKSGSFYIYDFFCTSFWMFSSFGWFGRSVQTLRSQAVGAGPNLSSKLHFIGINRDQHNPPAIAFSGSLLHPDWYKPSYPLLQREFSISNFSITNLTTICLHYTSGWAGTFPRLPDLLLGHKTSQGGWTASGTDSD